MEKHAPGAKKPYLLLALVFGAGLALIVVLTVLLLPEFRRLTDPAVQQALRVWVRSLGLAGWLFTLGVQILQVVIAFIPGEPVELLAGVLYGTWGGLGTCLLGILLASSFIFFTVRRFGCRLVYRLFGKDKLAEFEFLNKTEKVEAVVFLLFLIPGTPKDMLTYFAGVSRIKASSFLLLSTFARLPSVVTSTMMGATMSRGDWTGTLIVFLITAAIGLFGIFYKRRILDMLHRHGRKKG